MTEELGVEGLSKLRQSLRFGDIVVNYHASETNPNRKGVFVMFKEGSILVTNMKGSFWRPIFDSGSKLEIVGSIFISDQFLSYLDEEVEKINRWKSMGGDPYFHLERDTAINVLTRVKERYIQLTENNYHHTGINKINNEIY